MFCRICRSYSVFSDLNSKTHGYLQHRSKKIMFLYNAFLYSTLNYIYYYVYQRKIYYNEYNIILLLFIINKHNLS